MSKTITQIKRAMIAKGLNQTDLSKLSGIRRATISDLLSGRTEPRPDTLGPLIKALEIDVAKIEDERTLPSTLIELLLSLDSSDLKTIERSVLDLINFKASNRDAKRKSSK